MRLTEVESEYEAYKQRTQTEIIESNAKLESAEQKLAAQLNYDELVAQLKQAQYELAEKQNEVDRLHEEYKEKLFKKDEEYKVKDVYIDDLERQNDEFRGELDKI